MPEMEPALLASLQASSTKHFPMSAASSVAGAQIQFGVISLIRRLHVQFVLCHSSLLIFLPQKSQIVPPSLMSVQAARISCGEHGLPAMNLHEEQMHAKQAEKICMQAGETNPMHPRYPTLT